MTDPIKWISVTRVKSSIVILVKDLSLNIPALFISTSIRPIGVVGFVNTLKLEGQKYNINCNVLCPVAYTRMTENLMPPEAEQLLTPSSVTPAVIYLSSENGPFLF